MSYEILIALPNVFDYLLWQVYLLKFSLQPPYCQSNRLPLVSTCSTNFTATHLPRDMDDVISYVTFNITLPCVIPFA